METVTKQEFYASIAGIHGGLLVGVMIVSTPQDTFRDVLTSVFLVCIGALTVVYWWRARQQRPRV